MSIFEGGRDGGEAHGVCRRHRISDTAFYSRRSKYGWSEVSEMRPQLEKVNRLKAIVADRARNIGQRCAGKKFSALFIETRRPAGGALKRLNSPGRRARFSAI